MIVDKLLPQLPPILRGVEQWKAWLRVIAAPMQTVSNDLDGYESATRYKLQFNGQVIYLEHRLNASFDPMEHRIYIDDPQPTNTQPNVLTNRADNQPTIVVRNRGEANTVTVGVYNIAELQKPFDFVVFVPLSIYTNFQNTLRALVNYYRVAGKVWTFQTF